MYHPQSVAYISVAENGNFPKASERSGKHFFAGCKVSRRIFRTGDRKSERNVENEEWESIRIGTSIIPVKFLLGVRTEGAGRR